MIHARKDYQHIQDPTGKIGEDEPVFLLRAKDRTAPHLVRMWAAAQRQNPKVDPEVIRTAEQHARDMEAWQEKNSYKWADLPG